ncbi:uncharacterized protein LOC130992256 [Salvia miltiorrhiza]|uniref:uncharacterized protein LOC130992256 n=1 Tax=Salvia miltiorrhiza TaxID=226208 RepID=UPI0025ACA71C|nr:uncharacterized protein LOC130992256 [Salvia miltiorrhiza]
MYSHDHQLTHLLPCKENLLSSLQISQHHTANETKMSSDQYANEASTSRSKKQLVQLRSASASNPADCRGKAEIKQLEGRLKVLEEEAQILKVALLESMEESRTLITDIHLHFHTIQSRLLQQQAERGESYSHSIQIVKERRPGLLQILYQESNPSIVNNQSSITRFNLS